MQARLSATFEGARPLSPAGGAAASAAGGAAAAASEASLSAFSAASATRTSLVAAPRSGCCSRSLASSGLKLRSGSATRRPRTASRRASGSHMRGAPRASSRRSEALSHGLAKFEREGNTEQRFIQPKKLACSESRKQRVAHPDPSRALCTHAHA
eukprot:scaffold97047_cov54-Phaeocystis_antarctica.AAC.4